MSNTPEKAERNGISGTTRMILVALAIILIGNIAAHCLQTDFGAVKIIEVQIPTTAQQHVNGYLFVPREASADNKLPVVITMHGSLNSKEMQDAPGIELSRRGMIVLTLDAYNHGLSTLEVNNEGKDPDVASSTNGSLGMIPVVEFVYNNLEYADTSRISVMGHSMGGRASWSTVNHYGKLYEQAILDARQPDSDGGAEITAAEQESANARQKIYAALICGVANRTPGFFDKVYHTNFGMVYGGYEESGYRNRSGSPYLDPTSVELQELVNTHRPQDQHVAVVEHETWYGSIENRDARIIYQPEVTHAWIHFSSRATANIIDFFTTVNGIDTDLSPGNQRWNLKEFCNLVSMVGLFLLVVPLLRALLTTRVFEELRKPLPEAMPALDTPKKKGLFWGGILAGSVVSFVAIMITNKIYNLFPSRGHFFAEYTTNYIMLWGLMCSVWAIGWFVFIYKKYNSKAGATLESIGLRTTGRYIFKCILLALTLIAILYAIVAFSRWLWRTDFRIWCTAIKTFTPRKLQVIVSYLPLYLPYYIGSNLLINSALRVKGMSEKLNMFLCALSQVLGALFVFAVQYGTLLVNREPIWGAEWIPIMCVLFQIPLLVVASYFSRYFFRETGSIWAGTIFCCIFFLMMGACNTQDFTIPLLPMLY